MRSVLCIRADATTQMGTGHVMRCLALAQAWQDTGGHAIFLTASLPDALKARLEADGHEVVPLAVHRGTNADAKRTAQRAHEADARWVVVDGYHFSGAFHCQVRADGLKVLAVDDNGDTDHYWADLVVNQNLHAHERLYESREPYTRLLLGPSFAMLRREFRAWSGRQREVPTKARKLLVTLGGSDPDKVTLKVIDALGRVRTTNLETMVVIGAGCPHLAELTEAARSCPTPMRLQCNVGNMAELMAGADVAVAAGGSTTWERALLGLPSIVIVLAENQVQLAAAAAEAGIGWNLGRHEVLSASVLADAIERLLDATEERARMARRGRDLIDGRGAARICIEIAAAAVRLRPAGPGDCRQIWEWANEPATRSASFSSDPIPWEQHQRWFAGRLRDPGCVFLIVQNDGEAIGQVRFELKQSAAVISVSLTERFHRHGLGARVIRMAVDELLRTRPIELVHAYIRQENVASLRAFAKAGFAQPEATTVHGEAAVRLVLKRESA
jgi:UDP-2,4-diacetamido-2,4,6-trideoxy-beta-L-altropyranose hydrolase